MSSSNITNNVDEPITCPHNVYDQKAMRKKILQKTSLSLIQDDEKKFKCHCAMDEWTRVFFSRFSLMTKIVISVIDILYAACRCDAENLIKVDNNFLTLQR